jgi:uncharacterized protein YndB with AHSA1/START domain
MSVAEDTRSIVVERTMPHPPDKVWRALTQPELVSEWLMPTDLEATVGRRFNFRSQPVNGWNGITDCEVLEVSPPSRLVYSWNGHGEQAATGIRSVVTWTLSPAPGGGTHLHMEHAGFRPTDEGFYKGASYGWPLMIEALERVAGRL